MENIPSIIITAIAIAIAAFPLGYLFGKRHGQGQPRYFSQKEVGKRIRIIGKVRIPQTGRIFILAQDAAVQGNEEPTLFANADVPHGTIVDVVEEEGSIFLKGVQAK